jgi:hypothetical protein
MNTAELVGRTQSAYSQRNALAVAFVKMALLQGWPAGRGIDGREENDMEWRHVVYVDLPNGEQVSWHMAPSDVKLLDGLPCYRGEWNGQWTAKEVDWIKLLDVKAEPVEGLHEFASRVLSGFAHRRWLIEANKLELDPDVLPDVKDRILRGYATAWSKKV